MNKPIQPGELCVILRWGPDDPKYEANAGIFLRAVKRINQAWEFKEASRPLCVAIWADSGQGVYCSSSEEAQRVLHCTGRPAIPETFLLPIRDPDQGVDQEEKHDLPATV